MDVSDSHTYAAPVDAVLDMFGDSEAVVARYEGMGHRDVEVLECTRTDDSLRVTGAPRRRGARVHPDR